MKFATLCFLLLSAFHAWAAPLPSATEDSEECEPPAAVIRSPESVIRVGYTPFGLMIDERLMLGGQVGETALIETHGRAAGQLGGTSTAHEMLPLAVAPEEEIKCQPHDGQEDEHHPA